MRQPAIQPSAVVSARPPAVVSARPPVVRHSAIRRRPSSAAPAAVRQPAPAATAPDESDIAARRNRIAAAPARAIASNGRAPAPLDPSLAREYDALARENAALARENAALARAAHAAHTALRAIQSLPLSMVPIRHLPTHLGALVTPALAALSSARTVVGETALPPAIPDFVPPREFSRTASPWPSSTAAGGSPAPSSMGSPSPSMGSPASSPSPPVSAESPRRAGGRFAANCVVA